MKARGFTLVELLVALFVMSMLAVLSWRGIDGMTRTQAQTSARAEDVLTLQTGLSQWGADLDALVQLPQVTAIEWNGRVLRLTRRGSASASEGIRVVGWTRRDGQWMRWQSPALYARDEVEQAWQQADRWSQNPGDEERRYEVAVAPLQDWQVFYFRGDSWTNPLSSDAVGPAPANPFAAAIAAAAGPTARLTVVPDGVRVVLVLPEGGALSGRIVRDWVSPKVGGGKS